MEASSVDTTIEEKLKNKKRLGEGERKVGGWIFIECQSHPFTLTVCLLSKVIGIRNKVRGQ